jgi:hypothetical protein
MEDILSIIKFKNPEDVTQKELDRFQLLIEEALQNVKKLQGIYRSLTGRHYVPSIRC